jgi:hypothetical protein
MGDIDNDVREADLRNGEPGATVAETGPGGPAAPPEPMDLDQDPDSGQLPSDTDVQAERQPPQSAAEENG